MLIDANAALGPWPFAPLPERTAPRLVAHLKANGIGRALVSHLGAVFLPEPMPANRALFAAVRRTPALLPVPILNPALASWREHLTTCLAAAPLRAVKILPVHHNYSLRLPALADFLAALESAKIRLIIGTRLEDERHRYHALNIKGLPVAAIAAFLTRFPKTHVVLSGLYKPEIEQLAATHANFSADIAFAEWLRTLEILTKKIPARRLLLGTHTPLFETRAQVDKLRLAKISKRSATLIASENAVRLFGLSA
jgi:predicted TIM-barrel fold metal-dependent hydrolase